MDSEIEQHEQRVARTLDAHDTHGLADGGRAECRESTAEEAAALKLKAGEVAAPLAPLAAFEAGAHS